MAVRLRHLEKAATSRRLLALAVVGALAALAVVWPIQFLRETQVNPGDIASWADLTFAGVRADSRPEDRIGVFIPPRDSTSEIALWYAAQYAVIPATVEPIRLRDCMTSIGGDGCRLAGVNRFALADPDPLLVRTVEQQLHVRATGWAGEVLMFSKETR